MKKLSSLLVALVVVSIIYAQTPIGFSYQAVLRNTSGQVLGGQAAQLRVKLTSSNGQTTHYQELHDVTSTAQGLINVIIGDGTSKVGVLADVPWGNDQITMKTEIKVAPATAFTLLGTQPLQAVPYALYANNAKEVESSPTAGDDDPIFVVRNKLGQIVFAVYQEGVRVFVDDGTTKGTKGGFAVGGLSGIKESVEYFRITPDSARIWVNEGTKGAKGGFAVGGLSGIKLQRNFVQLLPNNYFIGQDAGKSILNGQYNIFIGHQAGSNTTGYHDDMEPTDGDNNIFLGYRAGFSNTTGQQNIYLGAFSGEKNTSGESNTFVGAESGKNNTGYGNTYLGAQTGGFTSTGNTGYKNTFIGHWSGERNTSGNGNVFIGRECGSNNTTGYNNVYIGHLAGHDNTTGYGNVFIGPFSGRYSNQSNKLIIHNNGDAQANIPTNSLIYGDFNAKTLRFNANIGVNIAANAAYGLIVDMSSTTSSYGIRAYGNGYGVYGWAGGIGSSTTRYGIFGSATGGTTNWAGYFSGDVGYTGSLTHVSDVKFKKNINSIKGALNKILQLQGVRYEWKSNSELKGIIKDIDSSQNDTGNKFIFSSGIQIGVIAQDVEAIIPELVKTDADGLKSVDYVKFTPLLIEAIKEQQTIIDMQQKELDLLKAELDAIKKLLSK